MWWWLLSYASAEPAAYCEWTEIPWAGFGKPALPQGASWEFATIETGTAAGRLENTEAGLRFRGQIETAEAVFAVDLDATNPHLLYATSAKSLGSNAQIVQGGNTVVDQVYRGSGGPGASLRSASPFLSWSTPPVVWSQCNELTLLGPASSPTLREAIAQAELPAPVRANMVLRRGIHQVFEAPGKRPIAEVVNTRNDGWLSDVAILDEKKGWKKVAGLSLGTLVWGWVPDTALSEPVMMPGGSGSLGRSAAEAASNVTCTAETPLVAWDPDHTAEVGRLKPGTHAIGSWPVDWPPEALAVAAESTFPVRLPDVYPSQGTHLFAKIVPGCSPAPE